ncbi:OmpP1/FadL family transporter [Stakelama pacifica]|uniref:Long-chain fatty acid transport protein n=1 Tax=Stakelama pacifica TaxID=517720 RepID=A0A4R6FFA3_9SPHN|nr:outer membrane protein transport protein [Stakelama pacifica]TDN79932.1 long-chain fatty acid transport protein [Stakelama pacifica]GGO98250.1 long-chain fatty acid transporter [Stakelama pacifica]
MKTSSKLALAAATAMSSLCAFAGSANAQAFYLQEQSARAAGRAFSGEGADTGSSSLWWNPASIAGIDGIQANVSASLILPDGEIRNNGTAIVRPGQAAAPVGGYPVATNPIESGALPSGSVAVPIGDRLAVGLTFASPYSFTTDYDSGAWVRYSADRTRLRTYDIQPSIAFAVTPWLRIGGAANIEYAEATLTNALPNLSPALPDGLQSLSGDGWDVGWSAGAQADAGPVTVGLSYKSKIEHDLKGELNVSGLLGPLAAQNRSLSDVHATYSTPWQAIGSVRYAATNNLTLNAQVIRYGWSEFDAIRLGDPVNTAIPEDYKNSWSYAGGFDLKVDPKLTLRAGVQYAETPIRNDYRDARVPDSDRWNFATGASVQVSKAFAVDVAANYIRFKDAPITKPAGAYVGTPAQTLVGMNGELNDASAVVLSLGGRLSF